MASPILNENGWPVNAIEHQLAHVESNSIRVAYNYAEYLDACRDMVQWRADWSDGVKEK